MKRKITILIFCSAGFLLLSALLFGYKQFYSLRSEIDSTRLYEYGQFVSGILSILLSGFSIFLIYSTYILQSNQLTNSKDQLKVEKKNADYDLIDTTYNQILMDISNITYLKKISEKEYVKFTGYDSFYNWDEDKKTNPNSVLNHLVFILKAIEDYIYLVNKKISKKDDLYTFLLTRIYSLFHAKILWPVMEKIYNSPKARDHVDHEVIFEKIDKLIIDTYKFLLEKKVLNEPDHPRVKELLNI